jgi:hypothetical protein
MFFDFFVDFFDLIFSPQTDLDEIIENGQKSAIKPGITNKFPRSRGLYQKLLVVVVVVVAVVVVVVVSSKNIILIRFF